MEAESIVFYQLFMNTVHEQLSRNENRQNIYLVYSFFFYGILQGVSLIEVGETVKALGSTPLI